MDNNHTNGYHDPVREHSLQWINELIDARIEENISTFRQAPPREVNERLTQLEDEWDVERMTLANLGGIAAVGGLLGLTLGRRWFWLSALAGGFIVQQAIQGWSPPVSIARRFHMRTREEIEREYSALCNVLADRGEKVTHPSKPDAPSIPHAEPGMGAPPVFGDRPPDVPPHPAL